MRIIKKDKKIKLSAFAKLIEYTLNNKKIIFSTTLKVKMLEKIVTKQIVIKKDTHDEIIDSLRKIMYEQILQNEKIFQTNLQTLEDKKVFALIKEMEKGNKTQIANYLLQKIIDEDIPAKEKIYDKIINWLREIIYNHIYKKEYIIPEDMQALEDKSLFTIIKKIEKDDQEIIEKYLNKDIKNPLLQFLDAIEKNCKELLIEVQEEQKKNKGLGIKIDLQNFNENMTKVCKDFLTIIYESNSIPKVDRDYSEGRLMKVRKLLLDLHIDTLNQKYKYRKVLEFNGWFINLDFDEKEKEKIVSYQNDSNKLNEYILSFGK